MNATIPPTLVEAAAVVATQYAVEKLRRLGWTTDEIISAANVTPVTETHLLDRCREALRLAMPQAAADYEEAMRARMPAVAMKTLEASAALAGIAAANAFHQAERPARIEHPTDPDGIALHLPDAPSIGIDV
jgi:hypothetical protein